MADDPYEQYVKDMRAKGLTPPSRARFEEIVGIGVGRPKFSPEAEEVISGVSRAFRERGRAPRYVSAVESGVTTGAEIGPKKLDQGAGLRALKFWDRFGDINKALDKVLKRGK